MSLIHEFLSEVEAFLEGTGMTATSFGHLSIGDPNFVFDLRNGREPRVSTVDRVREFMSVNRDAAPATPIQSVEAAE